MKQEHIKHLYWRAGFGVKPKDLVEKSNISRRQVISGLFGATQKWKPLKIDLSEFENIDFKTLKRNPKLAKELRQKNRKRILDLNKAWIEKMISSEDALQERMTLFWANHFVCSDKSVVHVQQYNNTLRKHALGDFRAFVKAISKEVAMIKYLNLRQNKKAEPNENFARELMELFTLGRGNYKEKDIKESARAFTGYSQNFKGEYVFRRFLHDYGQKSFLGKTGNFNGDDIIDIILEQRQCAKFICEKVYRYFVNDVINNIHVESMTNVFFKDYNIEKLMRFVFAKDWFYEDKNIGSKIKSPIDFLVGLSRTVPVDYRNERVLIKLQKLLGQTLFDPPNVAGWKGHKAWIDANTIMVRLKLASILLNGGMIALDDEKDQMRHQFFEKNKRKLPIKTTPDWYAFLSEYKTVFSEDLSSVLLSGIINKGTQSHIESMNKSSKQKFCIQLMSLPEYQMC